MKAIMLAAGTGVRLKQLARDSHPKVLLRIGGKSLLQRHIEILTRIGIKQLVLGVGYQQEKIVREIVELGAERFVRTVYNEDYESGNIVTLWTLRDELCGDGSLLLMDSDILYDERIIQRLIASPHENCLLLDRSSELDEEQVKSCVRNGEIIEFRKWLSAEGDFCAESVGMFKLSPQVARQLLSQTERYIHQARLNDPYEEAIRDLILTSARGTFGYEDIAGLPWIEIDFANDIKCAIRDILPRLNVAVADKPRVTRPRPELNIVQ
jgi:choline kinase